MRFAVVAATVATLGGGCRQVFGIDDTTVADDDDGDAGPGAADAPPGAIDATPPVDACMLGAIGSIDRCDLGIAAQTLVLDGAIDTDTDPRCATYPLVAGGSACLLYADAITVSGSVIVSGTRPLVLVSIGDVVIDGELDLSSHRQDGQVGAGANHASCAALREPELDVGGGAGGAGGSFGGKGGDGGTGDTNAGAGDDGDALSGLAGLAVAVPAQVRGGCPGSDGGDEAPGEGQGGTGGRSGGALWIAAGGTVTITGDGVVTANGAGGGGGQVQSGGGGGGSGGMIRIEASSISVEGVVAANGGGGGGGGIRINGAPYSGGGGEDGSPGPTPADGGPPGPLNAGPGGNGGAGTTPADAGDSSQNGAGGGGGATGIITIVGPLTGGGEILPPPV